MKIVFHPDFYRTYTSDPAAASGRMEAVVRMIEDRHEFVTPSPATPEDLARVHGESHIERVRDEGLYDIAALAAGGAIRTAQLGMSEPAFGLIRPPGHHASPDGFWGFCYFNNMGVALMKLKSEKRIQTAFVLDFDLHYGDGNVNSVGRSGFVDILNPSSRTRETYLSEVEGALERTEADVIGISAGFDHHENDWGGLLKTEDYQTMGRLAAQAATRCKAGLFAILEGGYNHTVLGRNVAALLDGMEGR